MSTTGADRTGQADRPGEAGPTADGAPGPGPAARTTTGTGRAAGETPVLGDGTRLPGQHPSDLTRLRLPELRSLRRDSQRDEADLSYLRRLLQGRIDILRAELSRRTGGPALLGTGSPLPGATPPLDPAPPGGAADPAPHGHPQDPAPQRGPQEPAPTPQRRAAPATADMVGRLAEILSDAPSRHRTSARHVTLSTPRGAECRRLAAETLAEVELSDLAARTDDELHAAMRRFVRNEQQISRRRHQLQRTVDGCSAEIARRYREGEAQVDDLLT